MRLGTASSGPTHPLTGGAAQFNAAHGRRAAPARADVSSSRGGASIRRSCYRGPVRDDALAAGRDVRAGGLLARLGRSAYLAARARREAVAFGARRPRAPVAPPGDGAAVPGSCSRRPARSVSVGSSSATTCSRTSRVPLAATLTRGDAPRAPTCSSPTRRTSAASWRGSGSEATPVVEAFHPRFVPDDLAVARRRRRRSLAERARLGRPGAPAARSTARSGRTRASTWRSRRLPGSTRRCDVKLVVAGRFWDGGPSCERQAAELGLPTGSSSATAMSRTRRPLSSSPPATRRSCRTARRASRASSQLASRHGRPVLATAVGGLPAAVRDERDGLLSRSRTTRALARAIERLAGEHPRLRAGVLEEAERYSFDRYAKLLCEAAA